jgi:hypothetical protein
MTQEAFERVMEGEDDWKERPPLAEFMLADGTTVTMHRTTDGMAMCENQTDSCVEVPASAPIAMAWYTFFSGFSEVQEVDYGDQ